MATSESKTPLATGSNPSNPFLQGPALYALVTAYLVIVPSLAIGNMMSNPRPSLIADILFLGLLGSFLVLHKAPVATTYKGVAAAILLGAVLPFFGTFNQFYMDVMIQIAMFCVLAIGLNVVVGFAGLLDLGYIAFYAVGAYTWAIVSTGQANNFISGGHFPLGPEWFFVFLPITLLIGAIFGVLLGLPVLRLKGDYLAIVTLGFGEVIRVLLTNFDRPINITNGAQGIKGIGQPPLFLNPIFNVLGLDLNRAQTVQLHFYVLVAVILLIMLLVVYRLSVSRIGRAWTAIREDETAAIAMGIPLVRMKLLAFVTGASFAGAMGMVFAAKQTFVNPPTFDLIRSINILAMVILGGMGSIPGVLLGATLVTLLNLQILPRITSELEARTNLPSTLDPAQYQRLIFGLMLVLMTIFRPQGLLPEERRNEELHEGESPEPADLPITPDDSPAPSGSLPTGSGDAEA